MINPSRVIVSLFYLECFYGYKDRGFPGHILEEAFGDRHKIRALIKVIGMHIDNTYICAYNNASILGTDHANHTQY